MPWVIIRDRSFPTDYCLNGVSKKDLKVKISMCLVGPRL